MLFNINRFSRQIEIDNEVLVQENNELNPVKVTSVVFLKEQGEFKNTFAQF